ncbi:MAG: hypothetical protein VKJ06_03155 [Vampirovibrionales bacterium]|nr:hypothetical protein [Vampirovibrionales bacterium]
MHSYAQADLQKRLQASRRAVPPKPAGMTGLVDTVAQSMGLETLTKTMAVLALWPTILQHTAPEFLESTRAVRVLSKSNSGLWLQVAAEDAATAAALGFYGHTFRDALNQYAPQTGITLAGVQPIVRKQA